MVRCRGRSLEGVMLNIRYFKTGVFLTLYWLTLFVLLKKDGIQRQFLIPVATLLLWIATAVSVVTPYGKRSQHYLCSISSLISFEH